MTLLNEQILDAFRAAGVDETLARKAAASVVDVGPIQRDLDQLKRDVAKLQRDTAVLKWEVAAILAVLLPMFLKLMFTH